MQSPDQVQRPWIAEVIERETWLAGERLGRPVSPREPVVQMRVAEILLAGAGAYFREQAERQTAGQVVNAK